MKRNDWRQDDMQCTPLHNGLEVVPILQSDVLFNLIVEVTREFNPF